MWVRVCGKKYTSFFGVISILYTVSFVVKRSLDGTYSEGGRFFEVCDDGLTPFDALLSKTGYPVKHVRLRRYFSGGCL